MRLSPASEAAVQRALSATIFLSAFQESLIDTGCAETDLAEAVGKDLRTLIKNKAPVSRF